MPPRQKTRYVAVDGLRGLAAMYVVAFHMNWHTHVAATQFIGNGYLAVDLFFIISGFVIASAYRERIPDGASFGRFMVRRLFRIYPLHVAVLAAFIGVELVRLALVLRGGAVDGELPFTGEHSVQLIVSHLLLLQGLGITDRFGWNAPSWSISTEFVAYILFGAVAMATMSVRRFLHPVLGLALAAGLYAALILGWGMISEVPLLRCLAGFLLGVGLLGLAERVQAVLGALSRRARDAVELVVAAATLVTLGTVSGAWTVAVIPLFAAAVLLASADDGGVSRALKTRPFALLGRTSYSIYLVHILCFVPFTFALKRLAGGESYARLSDGRSVMLIDPWIGDFALVLAATAVLLVARYTHRWVEEPGQRFGARLAGRLQAAPVAASAGARA